MKKLLWMALFVVTFFACTEFSASAVVNDTVKVGLRSGSSALVSANLENAEGQGYQFGYFNDSRQFTPLGSTSETTISMTSAGTIYMDENGSYSTGNPGGNSQVLGAWHLELSGYDSYEEAKSAANGYQDAYPAYISGDYTVRVGCYSNRSDAESAAEELGGEVISSSSTGVLITRTRSTEVLFEFDCRGAVNLGVMPTGKETWFKGYKYPGGFEYPRITGGNLNVINVVDLESYVKGVVPYEMPGSWPLEALKAQAVCARNFVCQTTKHQRYGFDVCASTDCQVYHGTGNGKSGPTQRSNEAVNSTEGVCMYYENQLIEAVYHSSDGGATEDAKNVWGADTPYLKGKSDPYEDMIEIPNYHYAVSYTMPELTWILQHSGHKIGTISNVYISKRTPLGNVSEVTFTDTSGKSLVLRGDSARMAFYSSTYGKHVPSLRFDLVGGGVPEAGGYYINDRSQFVSDLKGKSVLSGGGKKSHLSDSSLHVITSSGISPLGSGSAPGVSGGGESITITGTGNGHNVGMSQYGAKAMADQGFSYQDILKFYYTDITIR